MSAEGKGHILEPTKNRLLIYIPASVSNDSAFPFKKKDDVLIRIENNKLIIEPYKK